MTADSVLEQALQLPPDEREALCERIWESISSSDDDDLTVEQSEELQRRIAHYNENPDDVITWEDWKKEIFETRGLKL